MAKKRRKKATKKRKTAKRRTKKRAAKSRKAVPKKSGKRGQRYSERQQQSLLKKYHELRKSGATAEKAQKKVGVSYLTLLKWEKKYGKKIKTKRGRPAGKKGIAKKAALKKAFKGKAKAPPKQGGLALVTPSGFRIEGISPAELIRVLKAMK